MKDIISVVISSCDLYSDCWKPLFLSFRKNWGDSEFPFFLISNFKESGDDRISAIRVGEHLGWGSNTQKALKYIDSDYILLIQEDYFLNHPINDEIIRIHVNYCMQNNVDYLRLGAPFRDNNSTEYQMYCQDPIGEKYSLCLQPAIWKKETLKKLTIDGWTGWDYERNVNKYILDNNIAINSRVIHSSYSDKYGYNMVKGTGIRKGIWTQGGLKFLKENGFENELKGRGYEGKFLSAMMDVKDSSYFKLPARVMVRIIQKYKGLI